MSNVSGPSGQGPVAMHGTASITIRAELKSNDLAATPERMAQINEVAMKAFHSAPSTNPSAPASSPGTFGNFLNNVDASFEAKMQQMGEIGAKFDAMESESLRLLTSSKPGDKEKGQLLNDKLKAMRDAVSNWIKAQGEAANTVIRNSKNS